MAEVQLWQRHSFGKRHRHLWERFELQLVSLRLLSPLGHEHLIDCFLGVETVPSSVTVEVILRIRDDVELVAATAAQRLSMQRITRVSHGSSHNSTAGESKK